MKGQSPECNWQAALAAQPIPNKTESKMRLLWLLYIEGLRPPCPKIRILLRGIRPLVNFRILCSGKPKNQNHNLHFNTYQKIYRKKHKKHY